MNKDWSFYDAQTGLLDRGMLSTSDESAVVANTPPGHVAIEGRFDWRCQRVDLATGQVVDWQPPAPPADEWQTWTWQAGIRRWVTQPTAAAERRAERTRIAQAIERIEAGQARPLRALAIDPGNATERQRLQDMEAQIRALRASMPPP